MTRETFTGTLSSSMTSGNCLGVYDKASGSVRLYVSFAAGSAFSVDTTIFTVPAAYKPSSNYSGSLLFQNSADVIGAGTLRITSDGIVQQRGGSTVQKGFGVIEYPL